jgi:hypothetical protein
LGFIWDLGFGAWNFHDFFSANNFSIIFMCMFLEMEEKNVGEIKSTLDLVLEKTRNLTLSDEEKQVQKQKEIESRIKGLLQKLLDGLLTKNQLTKEYERLKKEADLSGDKLLADEVLTRLDPGQDTQILLEILEECCGLDTATIRAMIDDYRNAYNRAAEKRSVQLKEDLAQNHSISGTAVIANLDTDEQWQLKAKDMQMQFEDRLSKAEEKLIAG